MIKILPEVYEAFRSIDVPEDKALKIAAILSKPSGFSPRNDASKRDASLTELRRKVAVVEAMVALALAFEVAILIKLFTT
jgi:hypothetical protein